MIAYTATLTVPTPRGPRYQGVSYLGTRGPSRNANTRRWDDEAVPRRGIVRYRSPLRRSAIEAHEAARSRTIHHNVFHDGSEWARSAEARRLHAGIRCGEGRPG
jgi:hypothetical protein